MIHIDAIEQGNAARQIDRLAGLLIANGINIIGNDKSLHLKSYHNGIEVEATFERNKRTKQVKAINFDVNLGEHGIVRCYRDARMAASLIVSYHLGRHE
jgi:hypothetical protein